MTDRATACRWSTGLPWLAEFAPALAGVAPTGHVPATPPAIAVRRLGPRQDLAREAGMGESLGVDLLHAAVNEVLARHALPQTAVVSVAAPRDDAFAVEVFAGVVRACRAHGLPLEVPLAVPAATVDIALCLVGTVMPASATCAAPGDVVVALRGRGPNDGDFATLLAEASRRGMGPQTRLANGELLGRTLVVARASHASVLHDPIGLGWPFLGCAVGDGGLAGRLRAELPEGLDVDFDFRDWQPPSPFRDWFDASALPAAAVRTSLGCSLALVVGASDAERFLAHFAAWGEPGHVIGRISARGH